MRKEYLLILLVPVLVGLAFPILKFAVGAVSPFALNAARFLVAAILVLLITVYSKKQLYERTELKYGILLGLLLAGIYLTESIGIQWTSASNAGFLSDSTAIFVVIFGSLFFKHKTKPVAMLGVLAVFVGIYFLIFTEGIKVYKGDFLILVSPILGAFHMLLSYKIANKVFIPRLLMYQFFTVAIISSGLSFLLNVDLNIFSVNIILVLFYLGLILTGFRYFAEIFAMRKINPTNVALILLTIPIWAAIFSNIFLKEVLLPQQYVGCIFILGGIAFAEIKNR
jgi:drug/metabolite transporter (DMT)-like permease